MTDSNLSPFCLEDFIRQRQNAFDWPDSLGPQLEALAKTVLEGLPAKALLTHSPNVVDQTEKIARATLRIPTSAGVIFGHSAIQLLEQFLLVLSPKEVVIPGQDFFLFDLTLQKLGISPRTVDGTSDLAEDVPADHPVLLSAPNNPTGKNLAAADLRQLLENRSGLVIVDETYHLFARSPHERVPLLEEYPNLVLLRGLSKSGLPDWRSPTQYAHVQSRIATRGSMSAA